MVDIEEDEQEILLHTIQNGKIRKLTNYLEEASNISIDFSDRNGKTPLMHAVCFDGKDDVRTHMVRTLLRHGCDVNKQDMFGCTALMYACMDSNCDDVTRLLIKKGNSNPNIQDSSFNTALMHAVSASNSAALHILVTSTATRQKANLDLKNDLGLTVLDLAIKLRMAECCKVLVRDGYVNTRNVCDLNGLKMLLGTEIDSFGKEHSFLRLESQNSFIPKSSRRGSAGSTLSSTSMSSTPRCSNPTPEMIHQTRSSGDIPLSSRSNYANEHHKTHTYDISWVGSPRKIRRALTPLFKNSAKIIEETDEQNIFSFRARLPSIPSGKRLCMVATTQNDVS